MGFFPITTLGSTDTLSHTVTFGSINVWSNMKPVGRLGDPVSILGVIVAPGNPLIWVNNIPVSRVTDLTIYLGIPAIIITGNPLVLV
jgi:uncharacterized Zn-binding protein involved in type VI secretion